jgi:PIN domain nuclease of toxin-antitoxin system
VILVDTHVVVWLAFAQDRISPNARTAIHSARNKEDGLAICDITLWELTAISTKRRIQYSASLESFLQEVESRFVVLPISSRVCVRAMAFPASYPKDPADRVIGATALVQGLALVTADSAIRRSRLVQTIW